jgi:hypothetical protein
MKGRFAAAGLVIAAATVMSCVVTSPARAASIVDEWMSVKMPPAPALKPVTVDPKTTTLLMLDFVSQDPYCGPKRPRCGATLPAMKRLLVQARTKGVAVIFSVGGKFEAADIAKEIAPAANEPTVKSKSDKFLNTDLEKILKEKGIQTVIVAGNKANGAVLYTGTGATLRGFKVVIPVDGISADEPYEELLTVWQLAHGPGFGNLVAITKSDMIKFTASDKL